MKVIKTYNPIISETNYQSSWFVKIPVPAEGEVIILSNGKKMMEIDSRNFNSISSRQIRNSNFNRQIAIDVMPHNIKFDFESFSADQVHKFIFTVSAICVVDNPIAVYKSKITDMCSYAFSDIENAIKDMALDFNPEEVVGLSSVLDNQTSFLNTKVVGADVSNIKISVSVDDLYREHLKKKVELKQQTDLTQAELMAAKQLSEADISDTTAILSEVAKGNATLEQALEKLKAIRKTDFNDQVEQFTRLTNLYRELVDSGTLTEQQVTEIIRKQLPLISTTSVGTNAKQNNSLLLQDGATAEKNPYEVIDD